MNRQKNLFTKLFQEFKQLGIQIRLHDFLPVIEWKIKDILRRDKYLYQHYHVWISKNTLESILQPHYHIMLAGRLSVPTNPGTNILSAGETFEREKSAKDSQKIPSKSEIVIFCFLVNYFLILMGSLWQFSG